MLSTLSSLALEDVAATADNARRWLQLYFQPQREVTLDLLRRAEAAGNPALVVTRDAPVQPASRRALAAGCVMPPEGRPGSLAGYAPPPRRELAAGDSRGCQGLMADAPTWADLEWLLAQTTLPVLAKGVAHPDDVRRLRGLGVAHLLRCLREELEVVLALAGCATPADIAREALWRGGAEEDTTC